MFRRENQDRPLDIELGESESKPLLQNQDGGRRNAVATLKKPDHVAGNEFDSVAPKKLQVGSDFDASLHQAIRRSSAREIQILLARGARVEAMDCHGETSLHVCLKLTKRKDILMMLLSHGVKNSAEQQRARANMVNWRGESLLCAAVEAHWEDAARALLEAGADAAKHPSPHPECKAPLVDIGEPLIHVLVQNKNKQWLNLILQHSGQEGLINCKNSNGQTPLYVAIKEQNLEIYKILRHYGASMKNVCGTMNALHAVITFIKDGRRDTTFFKHILDTEDVTDIINDCGGDDGYAPIHLIVASNEKELAAELLNRFPKEVNAVDKSGRTPMDVAVNKVNRDMIVSLLDRGALPTLSIIKEITEKVPYHEELLSKAFDNCITQRVVDNEKVITVDFTWMAGQKDLNQLKFAEELDNCGESKLLSHPLMDSLLNVKWQRLRPIFIIILAMNIIYTVILTACAENFIYNNESPKNDTRACNCTNGLYEIPYKPVPELHALSGTNEDVAQFPNQIGGHWVFMAVIPILIALLLLVVRILLHLYLPSTKLTTEAIKLNKGGQRETENARVTTLLPQSPVWLKEYLYTTVRGWRAYICQWESWIKLVTLLLGAVVLEILALGDLKDPTTDLWLRHLFSLAVLMSRVTVILLCSRLPWGYNSLIIGKVAINFGKILLTCVLWILAGINLIFRLLFRRMPPFDSWIGGLTFTFGFMLGELNYQDLFETLKSPSEFLVHLWFIVFVICVPIVIMSSMVGMAVNDINKLTVTGNISRLRMQAVLLTTFDELVYNGKFNRILRRDADDINKKRFVYSLTIKPDRESKFWTVRYGPSNSDFYVLELPSQLHNELVTRSKTEISVKEERKIVNEAKAQARFEEIINQLSTGFDDLRSEIAAVRREVNALHLPQIAIANNV